MYKKIFMGIAAAAALTLVSCSSDDLNSLSDNSSKNEAISFDGYLGRSAVSVNGSRGSELKIDDLKKPTEGFGVFGNYKNAEGLEFGSNLFNNEKVYWSSSPEPAKWKYDNTKYWPTEGHIDFLAYAPYVGQKTLKDNTSCIDFTVEKNVADQKDLLWANAKNQTKAKNSGENKVKFTFNHALAKIGYSLKQKEAYTNTTIKVTSIKLVGSGNTGAFYTKGTIDLSKENNDKKLWKIADDVTKQDFDWLSSVTSLTTNAAAANNYLFVIPQDFSATATDKLSVVVAYTVKTGETAELMNKVSKPITMKFEQGKAYMINLTIGLTPIEFDVTTVVDWTDGGKVDIPLN